MRGTKKIVAWFIGLSCLGALLATYAETNRYTIPYLLPELVPPPLPDTPINLKYPMKDRSGDFVTGMPQDPFYLKDPPAVQETVEYDPTTGMYIVSEKAGGIDVRPPMYMTYADYLKYTEKQQMDAYWKERANAVNLVEEKSIVPPIQVKKQFFDRLFGGSKIEIKPTGNVEMTLGANTQTTANPNIPIRNRRTGGFDFDMNINVNVVGKIGDKLQLGVKYNTQSGFAFDNTVKIGYTGEPDDIIRSIEAGNVSLPLPTRLITGSQTLFGVKTQLQFGRLTWTSVISQQQSKKQSITLENGAQQQTFSITSDQYEENKNFFLSQFFADHYDQALTQLPNIRSVVNIVRLEVWVTNRTAVTQNVRNVAAFMDLGEAAPYETSLGASGDSRPRNAANNLYGKLTALPSTRLLSNAVQVVESPPLLLQQGQDFEMAYTRKLNGNEYTFNSQLGYISLNSQLNPNDVLAVAFQYEYNGQVFQVGEFGDQVPPDSNAVSKVLFLKLLKGTAPRVNLPVWNLMMKNIYSLGAFNISNQNFFLDIYYNDPGGGLKRYMPQGCVEGKPIISLLNLDNLDMNNDPTPDGLFDFLPGITILPQNGKLIFPVKEPFGQDLARQFNACGSSALDPTYTYQQLYDSTKFIAQQFPENNRFVIKGTYRGAAGSGSQISLGAGNIPRGSVTVTAGGQKLVEGTDYTVDYNLGRVTILNQAVINSGQQVKVDFENNNQFATQTQSMYGTRLDYKISPKFNIGATLITLAERPFTQKVNIGDDPIKNTIMGTDIKYETNIPWITKALSKIYNTKEMSSISTYGEMAYLKPGHSKAINDPNHQGQVYIDDFEGTSSGYDLKTPPTAWHLSGTPHDAPNASGHVMFPEASLVNDERYGYNRALLSWYRIDNSFFTQQTSPSAIYNTPHNWQNHYVRLVPYQEVFPNAPSQTLDQNLYSFDLAYFPTQRGPYNYESTPAGSAYSRGVNPDGSLKQPSSRWAGIMRGMDNTDFVGTNVEYIEFWIMDPFIYNQTSQGGHLYFDLGYISEDVLQDSRQAFENGLSSDPTTVDTTFWGIVPKLVPLVNAFDNDPTLRPVQDVGLDGMSDAEERVRKQTFLTNMSSAYFTAAATAAANADPSTDNYLYFDDQSLTSDSSIIDRYKHYEGTEGNSPIQTNSIETTAGTSLPDKEDVNNDNTMNQDEEYFQYDVFLRPGMNVGTNPYIVTTIQGANDDQGVPSRWLQFRIPIESYTSRVGSINDFTSIQFMRLFLSGFSDPQVILRFGLLQLTRNQWRTYDLSIDDACDGPSPHGGQAAFFNVGSVGLEANGSKIPVNYVLPPTILRQQALGAQTNQYVAQDEQSLALSVCDLPDCGRKAVFKNMNLDLRNYTRLEMFVHANRIEGQVAVKDSQVTAFIRLGSDFVDNYYEYEIPLKITPDGNYDTNNSNDQYTVWPEVNTMSATLQDFITLKEKRNATNGYPLNVPFTSHDAVGNLITIKGNPDIGAVKTVMLGIHNPSRSDPNNPLGKIDDGQAKCVEVWFDELRVNGFNEQGGVAALATANLKLADLGNIGLAGNMHTAGFGQVDQKIDARYKDNLYSYNFTTNLEVGKFIPANVGVRIPFYANYSQAFSTPEYDPYQFDIKSKDMLNIIRAAYGADSARRYAQTIRTITSTRGFNFTNVRIVPKTKSKRPHIYDPGNFNFTYSYSNITYSDPFTQLNSKKTWIGIIGWNFAPQTKDFSPFKKVIKTKSKWLDLVRDFSFNPYPSTLGVNSTWNRQLNTIELRSLGDVDFPIPPAYAKQFMWNRSYTFKYNPFKSLSIDYTALDKAIIDEPPGLLNNRPSIDSTWNNVFKGGRNINYNQNLNVNYNLPINKLPVFDFITASVGYSATYSWTGLPLVYDSATSRLGQDPLGNIISNSQNDRAKADLNFKKLYDKIPFLKTYDNPNSNPGDKKENDKKRAAIKNARAKIKDEITKLKDKRLVIKADLAQAKADLKTDTTGTKAGDVARLKKDLKNNKKSIRQKKKDYRSKQYPANSWLSIIMRPLLSLKKAGANYVETKATTLPGFEGYSRLLGEDYVTKSPGWGFVFGGQPGDKFFKGVDANKREAFLNTAAQRGWISTDTLLNQPFTQNRSDRLDGTATLEPWPDFKIDLTLFKSYTQNYSEFFKYNLDSLTGNYDFQHLTPMTMGSYSISYLPIKTLFAKVTSTGYSQTYNRFVNDRSIISNRLGQANPNSRQRVPYYNPSDSITEAAYSDGYGPLSQDVLIPAFLAAYTKADPNKISLNPFNSFPMPNWRFSYNGFSKFKWIQKYFTNVTISSGYNSTLTLNSYSTNLSYTGDGTMTGSKQKDTLSGNFYALYTLPSIVINEQFSPLIGVDVTSKNGVTAKFDFKMSRTLTMSFADFQMIELNSKQVTVGAGYKIKGLKLPFKLPNGKKIRLNNDLNFRFDFSYRDDITINHLIDQGDPQITQGATTISIQPSVDYLISKQLTVKLFFDQTRTIPKISSTYPTTNTKAGITFRFSLTQ